MDYRNNLLKSEQGSVMVEFALISMLLILILVGIIQFGLIFNTQLQLENAARDGARYTAVPTNRTDSEIKAYIISSLPMVQLTTGDIQITPVIRQSGQPFTLAITYNYRMPVTFGFLPQNYTLKAQAVMMKE